MLILKKDQRNITTYDIVPKDIQSTTDCATTPNITLVHHRNKLFFRWCREEHRLLHEICSMFLTFMDQINIRRYAIKLDKEGFLRSVIKFLYETRS